MKLRRDPGDRERVVVEQHPVARRVRRRDQAVFLELAELLVGDAGRLGELGAGEDHLGLRQARSRRAPRCRCTAAVAVRASSASAARRVISNSGSAGARPCALLRAWPAGVDRGSGAGAVAGPGVSPRSSWSSRSLITFSGRKCSRCSRRMKRRRSTSDGENLRYPDGVRSGSMRPWLSRKRIFEIVMSARQAA